MKTSLENKKEIQRLESNLEKAIEGFNGGVFGPKEHEKYLGIELQDIELPDKLALSKIKPYSQNRHLIFLPDIDRAGQPINLEYIINKYQPTNRRAVFNNETQDCLDENRYLTHHHQSILQEKIRPGWYLIPDKYLSLNSSIYSDYLEHSFQIAIQISRHINHNQSDFQQSIREIKEKYFAINENIHNDKACHELQKLTVNSRFRPNVIESILITSLLCEKKKNHPEFHSQIVDALEKEQSIWTSTLDNDDEFMILVPYDNYCQFGLASAHPFYSVANELGAICMYPLSDKRKL